MDKKIILLIDAVISAVILIVILQMIGIEKILVELQNIDYFYLALSIVFLFVMDFVMSYRIQMLLKASGVIVRFRDAFMSHMSGMLLSDFTPGRSGYFITAAALKYNHNVPSEKAMMAILGPQALDFIVKVVSGTTFMLYLTWYVLQIKEVWFIFMGATMMMIMIAVMLLLLFSKKFLALFSFANSIPVANRVYGMFVKMQDHTHVVIKKLPMLCVLVMLSWTGKALSWFFVAKSLGITLTLNFPEPLFYFLLQPTVTILEFIPSPTMAGLGLSEGGGAVLLSLFGISLAKAVSFVFLARAKTTVTNLIALPETIKTLKGVKNDIF
jgi:uncharacterized protein (TIRG00374 family)